MPTNCLIPKQAEKLKKAFREGKITFSMLYDLGSSQARIDFLTKYVGSSAKLLNTKLEKVFLSPNQKLAARNWIYQNIGEGKPLYKELTMEDAKKLKDNLNIRDLSKMDSDGRIEALSKYVDKKVATSLNSRFIKLKKSGNLSNWEARTMGTDLLKADKKMKGEISKLEALNDLGVLNPKQLEQFMESFVESKLGLNLSVDEAKQLSKLVGEQKDAFDKLMETNDWTYTNEENLTNYLERVIKLEEFENDLMPSTKSAIFNNIADYMRASILASPRILRNSFLYQVIPGIERAITKRLVSSNFSNGELTSNIAEKMRSKLSGVKPSKESATFIKKQTAMAARIYHKTGYDISRMQTLDDGYKFFGEKVGQIKGKGIIGKFAKIVNLAPKWMAGGTDMLFANIGRADTSIMMSKEIAHLESIKGKLPKGMSEQERANELLKDSYSFTPQDPQAQKIRELGILDAHMMNNTQPDAMADKIVKFRDSLKIGKLKFGKVIIPFAKIATTAISDGLKTASGYGVIDGVIKINKASRKTGNERSTEMQKGIGSLIRYLGFAGAVMLLASLLDDDDYIAPYNSLTYNEYKIARSRGANPGMVRIGGKWIPLRYLPIVNIPLSAIMMARQAKTKDENPTIAYFKSMFGTILDTPGIKETGDIINKFTKLLKTKDAESAADSIGLTGEDMLNWSKVRMIPSVLSYDLYNKIVEQDSKYDFIGREIEKGGIFKDDKTNEIILEFNKLDKEGEMPVISNPSGKYVDELEEKLGEEKYYEKLSGFQIKYTDEVSKILNKSWYKNSTAEEKKDEIDSLRREYVLDELKYLNEDTDY